VTTRWWLVAGCLVLAAVVVSLPQPARWTRLMGARRRGPRWPAALLGGRALVGYIAIGAAGAVVLAGPVAALAVGGYGALAIRALGRRRAAHAAARQRARTVDALCALAADLRAGLPPAATTPAALDDPRVAELAGAAWTLAEQTGAPLADLVERIEADLRAADRARSSGAAQAAGARATAWLLAGLPVGGIALGYGIGVDPLAVLLHTPVGAACAVGAIVLQVGGLTWADRLASPLAAGATP
jgi:tight adherence protein B